MSLKILLLAGLSFVSGEPDVPQADTVCQSLSHLVTQAGDHFQALKGQGSLLAKDGRSMIASTYVFPGFSEAGINANSNISYQTVQSYPFAGDEQALAQTNALLKGIRACGYGVAIPNTYSTPTRKLYNWYTGTSQDGDGNDYSTSFALELAQTDAGYQVWLWVTRFDGKNVSTAQAQQGQTLADVVATPFPNAVALRPENRGNLERQQRMDAINQETESLKRILAKVDDPDDEEDIESLRIDALNTIDRLQSLVSDTLARYGDEMDESTRTNFRDYLEKLDSWEADLESLDDN